MGPRSTRHARDLAKICACLSDMHQLHTHCRHRPTRNQHARRHEPATKPQQVRNKQGTRRTTTIRLRRTCTRPHTHGSWVAGSSRRWPELGTLIALQVPSHLHCELSLRRGLCSHSAFCRGAAGSSSSFLQSIKQKKQQMPAGRYTMCSANDRQTNPSASSTCNRGGSGEAAR